MKLYNLLKYELKKYARYKTTFIFSIILSFILLTGLIFATEIYKDETNFVEKFKLSVVDKDGTPFTKIIINEIIASESVKDNIEILFVDEKEAEELLKANQTAGTLLITENYMDNIQKGVFDPIYLYTNSKKPLESKIIKESMDSASYIMTSVQNSLFTVYKYVNVEEINPDEYDSLFNKAMLTLINTAFQRNKIFDKEYLTPFSNLSLTEYYSITVLILTLCIFSLQYVKIHNEDKDSKINQRLVIAGINRYHLLFAKVLASSIVLFLIGFTILLAINITFGLNNFIFILLNIFIISVTISLVAYVTCLLFDNSLTASSVIILLSILSSIIAGIVIPFFYLPGFINNTLKYFSPVFHWHEGIIGLGYKSASPSIILNSVIYLAITGIICISIIAIKNRFLEKRSGEYEL